MLPQMMLLPGLMCDGAVWTEQVKALAPMIDCQIADYGMADSIEAMADLVLASAPQRFVLAGHSMGGRVALEVCRKAPERVSHLILMDTGYKPRAAGEAGDKEQAGRFALLNKAREEGMRVMGQQWVQGMVHPERLDDQALVEEILAMIERKTPEIFAAQINALLNRPDATPVLESLSCPTLLLCGRQDSWSPLERHEEMAELVANAQLGAIEDAGHMSTMERPDEVSAAIKQWLETEL
ncbi:alpha/beta fold hydrolase [Marinobacterium lutimaris]|uniref:Pimeloyl-ACP methyl ester carboxylesterase n=1 Tax=Marinobacterium lutimaris TaxID=568106 RepID=A0A1H6DK71_9GAMM|nr:alpha/beta hydrolase [Marinobacterium lutimaris]SEG85668.1 Pimeloyl-ACP methyl ester carboxylesterase [Marinobacterium lutimaris]